MKYDVKQLGLMCLAVGFILSATPKLQAQSESQPASAPATQLTAASQLFDRGLNAALDGDFDIGLTLLKKADAQNPKNANIEKAINLIQNYQNQQSRFLNEQKKEYRYEINRIRWAMLAQKFQDNSANTELMDKIRKLIKDELIDEYQNIGTPENFEDASAQDAAEMQKTSLENIAKMKATLEKALALLKKRNGEYTKEFRSESNTLLKKLDACKTIWEKADPSSHKGRWECARRLFSAQDTLSDAVTDLEVMVTKNPWKVALLHGQLALEVAPSSQEATSRLWFLDLIKDAEARGNKAVKDAQWSDALTAFSALGELVPSNTNYQEMLKRVRRHVRARRLYGHVKTDDSETLTANHHSTDDEDDDQPVWKDIVEGVDVNMARRAIRQLGESYVKSVDYKKLAKGALESVKILATTPQVAETFPGLKNKKKLKDFVDVVDAELRDISKPDRVDHIRLQMALNRITEASENTVNIPIEVLVVEFADGFLAELDKFSGMIWPFDVESFNKNTMGEFTGVGIQISKEAGKPLKITTPLLGAPAMKAGLKAGDLILAVDGFPTEKASVDKLIKKIMGKPGTTVNLTIRRRGVAKPFVVPVVRQRVNVRTVKGWQREDNGQWDYVLPDGKTAYVRLTQFTNKTHTHLHEALAEMKQKGINSLVLDLRSNPGGLLRQATAIANEFLSTGRIVWTRGRQVPRNEITADSDGAFLKGNLVVLVDENSASAAEILSGALRDWNRGLVVGERSYGKGSVQNLIPIRKPDAYLKLTTAYYYLPSGRLLHRQPDAEDWGVNPDIAVGFTPKQMLRWLRIRQKTDLLQKFDPELLQADLKSQYNADIQLNTAVLILELMRLKQEADATHIAAAKKQAA